ncbi:MAG: LPS assembly lipoprotein LptE [Gammaproteobacteria bacterium]|nr:LPS assembly lipoprotein LptE [Gammaproteobacteria bacterium]
MKQINTIKLQLSALFSESFRGTLNEQQRVSLVFLMALMLAGCGFHLRGDIVLPELYERVHVVSKGNANVGKALSDALKNVGSQIVSSPEASTSVVTVLSSGTQRKALNVAGKAIREYELQLNISFVVQDNKGVQLAEQQTVSVIRNFQNDPDDVLGKDNEENIIRQEMMQPAIFQVLRRMKAIAK